MKCLTISQPFASLIASGEKWVENRTWETLYRGPIGIHAGKGTQYLTRPELRKYPTGCIVAIARLANVKRPDQYDMSEAHVPIHGTTRTVAEFLQHEHTEGPFCWILEDVRKLSEPIYWPGAQGLWVAPDDVVRQIAISIGKD